MNKLPLVLFATISSLTAVRVFAQTDSHGINQLQMNKKVAQPQAIVKPQTPQKIPPSQDYVGRKELAQPVSIPGLPAYTGKATFQGGVEFPNMPGGAGITQIYAAKEKWSDVVEWYRATLPQNGWKLDATQAAGEVSGMDRDGNFVMINADQRGKVVITYRHRSSQ